VTAQNRRDVEKFSSPLDQEKGRRALTPPTLSCNCRLAGPVPLHCIPISDMSVAIAMFVLGAGVPACLVTLTSLAVSDLPPEKVANGSGLQNFIRIMAMAVGASLTSTYWEDATKENRANLVSIIDPATTLTTPSGLPADSGLAVFSKMVDAQAVMLATNDFYAMATILIVIFAGVVWLAKRSKGPLKQVSH
jgi:DHA2 family multidrug resistance protein